MHLLMTTYRQDIMTNFGCVCNRSTVTYLPMFQGSFTKHTQACLSNNIFMLNSNFNTTVLFKLLK